MKRFSLVAGILLLVAGLVWAGSWTGTSPRGIYKPSIGEAPGTVGSGAWKNFDDSLSNIHNKLWEYNWRIVGADYTTLNAAVTAIGATPCTLVVVDEQTLTAETTIPSTLHLVFFKGGKITLGNYNLAINGPMDPYPLSQIFDDSGSGSVGFGAGYVKEVYPEWWGAVGDGSTNCAAAISSAISSISSIGGRIVFSSGIYYLGTTQVTIDGCKAITFEGASKHGGISKGTIIRSARSDTNPAILIGESTASHGLRFTNISFEETSQGYPLKIGGTSASTISFDDCDFRRTNANYDNDVVLLDNAVAIDFNNCTFRNYVDSSGGGSCLVIGSASNVTTTVSIRGHKSVIEGHSTNKNEYGINLVNAHQFVMEGGIFQYLADAIRATKYYGLTLMGTWFESNNTNMITFGANPDETTLIACEIDGTKIAGTYPDKFYSINCTSLADIKPYLDLDNSDASTSGTGEDNLKSTTISANQLLTTGGIRLRAAGTISGTAGTKTVKLYFGASAWTVMTQGADDNFDWLVEAEIYNTATNAQRIFWKRVEDYGSTDMGYETAAIDTTANVTVKLTGECSDAGTTITQTMWIVERI